MSLSLRQTLRSSLFCSLRVEGNECAAAAVALLDFTIGFGSGGATLRSPNTVEANAADAYPTTRSGLTFGVISSTFSTLTGAAPGGADGRFKSCINANGNFSYYKLLIPDGTWRVRSAQGWDQQALTPGLRIYNDATGAVLHAIAGASSQGQCMDILGADRAIAGWDANAGFKDVVVSGGQGVVLDRNNAPHFVLNSIRFQQLA